MKSIKRDEAFSSFSVSDVPKAMDFYGRVLGLDVVEERGALSIPIGAGKQIYVYPKENHVPAEYTAVNFLVDDIDAAVTELVAAGVHLEHYEGMTDEKGIARGIATGMGPDIAWFKDPAGNILAVLQQS